MTQFSVYRNKNPRTKTTFPFLVDIQSDLLEPLNTRVVVPLTRSAALTKKPVSHLTPEVSFEGDRVKATLRGQTVDLATHPIERVVKAVTYHGLEVEERDGAWWARVILDL